MLVLDFVRTATQASPSILVPRFHSGHLGFVPKTNVHVGLPRPLPGQHERHTEVLVTAFDTSPGDLALISLTLRDTIGVVRSIVRAVSHLGINIEVLESSSVDHLDRHRIAMLADLSEATVQSGVTPSRRIQYEYAPYATNVPIDDARLIALFDVIVAQSANKLVWQRTHNGRLLLELYIRPLPGRAMRNASQVALKASGDERHTEIKLPRQIREHITNRLAAPFPHSYIFVSDTTERNLRAYFLPPSQAKQLVHVGVYHSDKPGTLARILDVLAAAEFNIITSLLRKYDKRKSVWEGVLEYKGHDGDSPPERPSDTADLSNWYRKSLLPWTHGKLKDSPLLKEMLGTAVALGPPLYPKSYGGLDPKIRRRLSASRATVQAPRLTPLDIDGLLAQRAADLTALAGDAADESDTNEPTVTRNLIEVVTRHRQRLRKRTLFLSFPESVKELVEDYLRPELTGYHVTQYQESHPGDVRHSVITLIHRSDYFLGVWHPDGQSPAPRESLSPWLYFEYGVAFASGKPQVVAYHRGLPKTAWKRLESDSGLIDYDEADFATRAVPRILDGCARMFEKPADPGGGSEV